MNLKLFSFWLGGWFTYWAIGTAAVAAIGGVVKSNNEKKAAQAAANAAPYSNVDLQQEQKDALAGNLANQNSIEALLTRSNKFQQSQASSIAEQALPGIQKLTGALSSRAQQLADHPYDVPADVTKNLERLAAESGFSAGTRGQFNDFSLIRDFGINSLQYGQSNLAQAQSITGLLSSIAPKVNPMSPLSFYVTPQQNAATTTENNTNNQAIAQAGANNIARVNSQANTDLWSNLSQLAGAGIAAYGKGKSSSSSGSASASKDATLF